MLAAFGLLPSRFPGLSFVRGYPGLVAKFPQIFGLGGEESFQYRFKTPTPFLNATGPPSALNFRSVSCSNSLSLA